MYKRGKYKNESNISWRVWKSGVKVLKIKETDEIWPSMRHVGDGLGVKNIWLSFKINMWYLWDKRINKRWNQELQNDRKRNIWKVY